MGHTFLAIILVGSILGACSTGAVTAYENASSPIEYGGGISESYDPRVALVVDKQSVACKGSDCTLKAQSILFFGTSPICKNTWIYNQPIILGASCTAFRVGRNQTVMAGVSHCMNPKGITPCDRSYVIFDYDKKRTLIRDTQGLVTGVVVPRANVFTCSNGREQGDQLNDWALFRLDRASGREGFEVRSSSVVLNESVSMIGHPMAVPQKHSTGGSVRAIDPRGIFFHMDLSAYPASSGSPVIDAKGFLVGMFNLPPAAFPGLRDQFVQLPSETCLRPRVVPAELPQGLSVSAYYVGAQPINQAFLDTMQSMSGEPLPKAAPTSTLESTCQAILTTSCPTSCAPCGVGLYQNPKSGAWSGGCIYDFKAKAKSVTGSEENWCKVWRNECVATLARQQLGDENACGVIPIN